MRRKLGEVFCFMSLGSFVPLIAPLLGCRSFQKIIVWYFYVRILRLCMEALNHCVFLSYSKKLLSQQMFNKFPHFNDSEDLF